jgi:hypothetical protein
MRRVLGIDAPLVCAGDARAKDMWKDFLYRMQVLRIGAAFRFGDARPRVGHAGAALRGALGRALAADASTRRVFDELFVTPVPEGAARMRRYRFAPHPFVLRVGGERCGRSQRLDVEVVLFGNLVSHGPLVARALASIADAGLGAARDPLVLESLVERTRQGERAIDRDAWLIAGGGVVADEIAPEVLRACGAAAVDLRVSARAPIRVVHEGAVVRHWSMPALVPNVLRRVTSLASFHGGFEVAGDFRGLVRRARAYSFTEARAGWAAAARRSTRNRNRQPLGGIVGEAVCRDVPAEIATLLALGSLVHAGKGTSFGLGHYEVALAERPAHAALVCEGLAQ